MKRYRSWEFWFDVVTLMVGFTILAVVADQGFGLSASWYWWPLLGVGTALVIRGMAE